MKFHDELLKIRHAGMQQAAVIWEILEASPTPIAAADIYKAVTALKCAEFSVRIQNYPLAPALLECLIRFLDDTLKLAGGENEGDYAAGVRVTKVLEVAMPLTDEIFNDAALLAQRQHTYEGLLLLAAVKLGKEVETQRCIDELAMSVSRLLIQKYLAESENLNFDMDTPTA